MKPIITKHKMEDLPGYAAKQLCDHQPRCFYFFTITTHKDGFWVCEEDIRQTTFQLMKDLDIMKLNGHIPMATHAWTVKQELFVIDYIQKNGVQHGTYTIIGELIGKTRIQVKDKVCKLRKQGRLV